MFWTDFIPENIASVTNAHHIGVYKINSEDNTQTRVGTILLNNLKNEGDDKYFRFGVISDIHLYNRYSKTRAVETESEKNERSLDNFKNAQEFFKSKGAAFVCNCGDVVINPSVNYSDSFIMPVFSAKGHEDFEMPNNTWWDKTMTEENEKVAKIHYSNKVNNCNFYFEYGNCTFIFFSSDSENGGVYMQKNIEWLHNVLETFKGQKCFVFMHSPFFNKAGNLYPSYADVYEEENLLHYKNDFNSYDKLDRLQDHYKNAIWFNGQTAYPLEYQALEKKQNVCATQGLVSSTGEIEVGYDIHVPGLGYVNELKDVLNSKGEVIGQTYEHNWEASQGLLVTVYKNYLLVNGVSFREDGNVTNKYIPIAAYKLPTVIKYVSSDEGLLDDMVKNRSIINVDKE